MRVACLYNVAQNAYLVASFLRRYTNIDAYSYDGGIGLAMWVPQWEHGEFDLACIGPSTTVYDWRDVPMDNGFRRPPWARILGDDRTPADFQDEAEQREWWAVHEASGERVAVPVLNAFSRRHGAPSYRTPAPDVALPDDFPDTLPWVAPGLVRDWRTIRQLQCEYDLVVLFGGAARAGAFLPARSYVTFEHATMRHVEERQTTEQQLLAHSYQRAAWNILTNADCHRAADALGITRYSFIPHPVDTDTFSPAPTERSASLRRSLLSWSGASVLFLSPTRHSSSRHSGEKNNAAALRAYAEYVHEREPRGAPRAHLLLSLWGDAVPQSRDLCAELGITDRVSWYPLLPKRQLADLYRACDVVLDQFSEEVGSFGTITVEALATGRPVITHVAPERHAWCAHVLPLPPVVNEREPPDICEALVRLAQHAGLRMELGAAGRRWVEEYHGPERVAQLHAEVYRRAIAEMTAGVAGVAVDAAATSSGARKIGQLYDLPVVVRPMAGQEVHA